MIKRKYFNLIEKELKTTKITALIGLRQVGKTTILNYAYEKVKENAIFIKFDDIKYLNYFENDIDFFIEQYVKPYKYIFIDEIQYSKNSGKRLKFIIDTFKDKKILISGSSLPEIAIHSLSYLVGRVNIIQIFPIDFKEVIEYKSPEKTKLFNDIRTQKQLELLKLEFNEYLQYGGYPEIVLGQNQEDKKKELNNIVNTYLLKEIREILNFENIFEFEKSLVRIALSDGGIMNKSNIASELEINRINFNKIIDILYKTAILYPLQPFLKNKIKEIVKSPKMYLSDLGFKNSLIKNFNTIELRQDKGSIYENFVLSSILNYELEPKFWNLKNEFEVDFVLEGNDLVYGIECKSSLKDDNITVSMKKFIEMYNPKQLIILNTRIDSKRMVNNTEVLFTNYLNIFSLLDKIKKNI